jgi:hypothetical protein
MIPTPVCGREAVFEVPMATVRTGISKHASGDRLRASLRALTGLAATVSYVRS